MATAYTTITIEGGSRMPSVPALITTPVAYFSEELFRTMPAIAIEPTATRRQWRRCAVVACRLSAIGKFKDPTLAQTLTRLGSGPVNRR